LETPLDPIWTDEVYLEVGTILPLSRSNFIENNLSSQGVAAPEPGRDVEPVLLPQRSEKLDGMSLGLM